MLKRLAREKIKKMEQILNKNKSNNISDKEIKEMMKDPKYKYDKEHQMKVEQYFKTKYPGKVKYDATGKAIDGEVYVKSHRRDGIHIDAYMRSFPN